MLNELLAVDLHILEAGGDPEADAVLLAVLIS